MQGQERPPGRHGGFPGVPGPQQQRLEVEATPAAPRRLDATRRRPARRLPGGLAAAPKAVKHKAANDEQDNEKGAFGGGVAKTPEAAPTLDSAALLFRPLAVLMITGAAVVPVRVPDRLTTWRVLALAHSRTGAQGGAVTSFLGTLPTYVDPVVPAFLIKGDEVRLPIQVVNTTAKDVTGNVLHRLRGYAPRSPASGSTDASPSAGVLHRYVLALPQDDGDERQAQAHAGVRPANRALSRFREVRLGAAAAHLLGHADAVVLDLQDRPVAGRARASTTLPLPRRGRDQGRRDGLPRPWRPARLAPSRCRACSRRWLRISKVASRALNSRFSSGLLQVRQVALDPQRLRAARSPASGLELPGRGQVATRARSAARR